MLILNKAKLQNFLLLLKCHILVVSVKGKIQIFYISSKKSFMLCKCLLYLAYLLEHLNSILSVLLLPSSPFFVILDCSVPFHLNSRYISSAHTVCTQYFLDTSFSMTLTYVIYLFQECSLFLYKTDQFKIYLSVF